MPNTAIDRISHKYAAKTSYGDTPPRGRQSITIGSEQKTSNATWASEATSFPKTIASGRKGLASNISYVLRSFSPVIDPEAKLGTIIEASTYCPTKKRSTSCFVAFAAAEPLVMSSRSSCGQAI